MKATRPADPPRIVIAVFDWPANPAALTGIDATDWSEIAEPDSSRRVAHYGARKTTTEASINLAQGHVTIAVRGKAVFAGAASALPMPPVNHTMTRYFP